MACVREIIHADQRLTIREVGMCQKILTEELQMRRVSEICAPSPDSGAEGRSHVNLH